MRLVLEKGVGAQHAAPLQFATVIQRLEAMGYARVATVTEVAQFSVRGGILDVYGFGMAAPARLEWWGDEIESLRTFDLDSQRSGEAIERVTVLPVKTEGGQAGDVGAQHAAPLPRQSLLDLLPSDALIVLEQESALGQEVERAWAEAAHHLDVARRLGEEPPAREALFVDPAAWRAQLARFPRIALDPAETGVRFPIAAPEPVDRDIRRLRQIVATEPPTVILCDNEGQLERLEELLAGDRATLAVGALDGGFVLPGPRPTETRRRRGCTGSAPRRGSGSGTRRARRSARWRSSCSTCTRVASSRPDSRFHPTLRGSASSSRPSCTRIRRTSDGPPRKSSGTWSAPARWTGCWWVMWGTAKPRSHCAPPSRPYRRASRSRSWFPRPFSP